MYSYGPAHMAMQKQDDQHEHTFSRYVRIWDVVLKTCLGWWTIGRSGERESGISVLPARHDDDISLYIYIYIIIYIYIYISSYIYIYISHHVVLLTQISLTLSHHSSLSSIASGWSSRLHPVSVQSCSW